MIGSFFNSIIEWWKRDADEDFLYQLADNPFYPFEDLGNGIFYLQYNNGAYWVGLTCFVLSGWVMAALIYYNGIYTIPFFGWLVLLFFALSSLYGSWCTRELFLSKTWGYLIRLKANKQILVEQRLNNIYIRLVDYVDANREWHYYVVLGGYMLEEIRISRYGESLVLMRGLARELAKNLNINYIDFNDYAWEHQIVHTRGKFGRAPWREADIFGLFEQYDLNSKWRNEYEARRIPMQRFRFEAKKRKLDLSDEYDKRLDEATEYVSDFIPRTESEKELVKIRQRTGKIPNLPVKLF